MPGFNEKKERLGKRCRSGGNFDESGAQHVVGHPPRSRVRVEDYSPRSERGPIHLVRSCEDYHFPAPTPHTVSPYSSPASHTCPVGHGHGHCRRHHECAHRRLGLDARSRTPAHSYFASARAARATVVPPDVLSLVARCPSALNHRDEDGMSVLHHACANHCHPDVLRLLIDASAAAASVDGGTSGARLRDREGNLPLHLYVSSYVRGGHVSAASVRLLHESNVRGASTRNANGDVPLHILCRRWHPYEIGEALLEADATTVRTPDRDGRLPLAIACEWRVVSRRLLQRMCDMYPQAASVKDWYGDVPLHIVCRTYPEDVPEKEILFALVRAAPHTVADPNSDSTLPVHAACEWVLATSRVVLLPDKTDFFRWPRFLSEHMCSLEILACFLRADPERSAPEALRFLCRELAERPLDETCHLVTALALEFALRTMFGHDDDDDDDLSNHVPRVGEAPTVSDRADLMTATLVAAADPEGPLADLSHRAFHVLFGPQWFGADGTSVALSDDAASNDDDAATTPLHEATKAGPVLDPRVVERVVELWPEAARVRDSRGLLPLEHAVASGAPYEAVRAVLDANPGPVLGDERRHRAGELPLALEAAANDAETNVIYHLLLSNPSVMRPP